MNRFNVILFCILCLVIATDGVFAVNNEMTQLCLNELSVTRSDEILNSKEYQRLNKELLEDLPFEKKWFWDSNKKVDPFSPERVLTLEDRLNALVLDQPEAANCVVKSIMNFAAGLKDPETPVGVFLFLGPTGVGKTEFAKALCQEVFEDKELMVRFDMSSFAEPHSGARLIGSPPGYIGSMDGGQLTNPLLKNPKRIILLDEVEKAHSNVLKIFLPIFDEGKITDSRGKLAKCQNTIFILTSNLCSTKISQLVGLGLSEDEVMHAIESDLMKSLSPELYNRVEPIVFRPLSEETIGKLVDLMLDQVTKRLMTNKKIKLIIDPAIKPYLAEKGYHPDLGARPLRRLIEKDVVASISYAIISEKIPNGSTISLYYSEDSNVWHVKW